MSRNAYCFGIDLGTSSSSICYVNPSGRHPLRHVVGFRTPAETKQWAKRDKQIGRVLLNTAGMYGDLQGIIGNALPLVKTLELPRGAINAAD